MALGLGATTSNGSLQNPDVKGQAKRLSVITVVVAVVTMIRNNEEHSYCCRRQVPRTIRSKQSQNMCCEVLLQSNLRLACAHVENTLSQMVIP